MSQIKCYNCGGRGHIARVCTYHGGGNHRGVRGASDSTGVTIGVAEAELTGVTTRMEVDTGVVIRMEVPM